VFFKSFKLGPKEHLPKLVVQMMNVKHEISVVFYSPWAISFLQLNQRRYLAKMKLTAVI